MAHSRVQSRPRLQHRSRLSAARVRTRKQERKKTRKTRGFGLRRPAVPAADCCCEVQAAVQKMQPQGLGDGQKSKHGRNKLSGLVSAEGATHVSISFPGHPGRRCSGPSATTGVHLISIFRHSSPSLPCTSGAHFGLLEIPASPSSRPLSCLCCTIMDVPTTKPAIRRPR